jgi:hypothetical protein
MNILEKFLGFELDEDFTDTDWWADAVFQGLAQEPDEQTGDFEAAEAAGSTGELA